MDALWFWFAKFLVDVGLFFGLTAMLVIVAVILYFIVEWRSKTGRDTEGRWARHQLLRRRPSESFSDEFTVLAHLSQRQSWTVHTRRSQQAALNRLVKQGYYERQGDTVRRTNKQASQ